MRSTTKNYFSPHELNNFKSKILHHSSLIALIVLLFVSSIAINYLQTIRPDVMGISYSISQQELLEQTNKARAENGVAPLTLNETLISAANGKAHHMLENNYWAHFAPDGTSPWSFIRGSGYSYVFAGENLAKGFTDSASIVKAWMNSPSHRENLLSEKYNDIGFAIMEGTLEGTETVLVVQMFGALDVPANTDQYVAVASDTLAPTPTLTPLPTLAALVSPTTVVTPTLVATEPATINEVEIEEQTLVAAPNPLISITPAFLNITAQNFPAINLNSVTRAIPTIVVLSLLMALIIDFVIIKKRNIPRMVGHNLDHIMILIMFLLLLLLTRFGTVL